MKKTGRSVYLSGIVREDTAEKVYVDGGANVGAFQNILVDERKGYAYKVTFATIYPNVTNRARTFISGYGIYSYSRRELLRMTDAQASAALGYTRDLAVDNRNVGIVGLPVGAARAPTLENVYNYQNNYVIKGDAMVTQSLAIGWQTDGGDNSSFQVNYYIEMDEYEVNDDEEILLILNERSQNAAGIQ
tara:strand:+ start:798 stop:1364 length:567 start_codon:yes stop_codon:yes gene_type:complete